MEPNKDSSEKPTNDCHQGEPLWGSGEERPEDDIAIFSSCQGSYTNIPVELYPNLGLVALECHFEPDQTSQEAFMLIQIQTIDMEYHTGIKVFNQLETLDRDDIEQMLEELHYHPEDADWTLIFCTDCQHEADEDWTEMKADIILEGIGVLLSIHNEDCGADSVNNHW
tara:strand:- start:7356 stop:7859 length:504 start_codon:yes stop_codon:yes gene_type:complete